MTTTPDRRIYTAAELDEHHAYRRIVNTVSRTWDRRTKGLTGAGEPVTLRELTGFVVVNARPVNVGPRRWALWCAYVALTGRRPPAWWSRIGLRP